MPTKLLIPCLTHALQHPLGIVVQSCLMNCDNNEVARRSRGNQQTIKWPLTKLRQTFCILENTDFETDNGRVWHVGNHFTALIDFEAKNKNKELETPIRTKGQNTSDLIVIGPFNGQMWLVTESRFPIKTFRTTHKVICRP